MHHWQRGLLLAGAVGAAVSAASAADSGPSDLEARINALQAEVQQLKVQQQAQKQAKEVDETTQAVQADAARHSRLLDVEGFTAGYLPDRGFVLQSADGRFLLHPWAYMQFRNATLYRDKPAGSDSGGDTQSGFELRRAKVIIDGNVYSPDLTFQAIAAVDRHNGNFALEDAWARYHLPGTEFAIRAGQIRNPLDREQINFATNSLTSERSLINDLFANVDGIVQGVSLEYGYDRNSTWRAAVAVTDGLRSANTNFQTFPTAGVPADWGASGRIEYKFMGDWTQYRDFTALGDTKDLLVVGAGADYTEAGDTGQFTHVVDAQYESTGGLSLYAAYLGRYVHNNGGPPGTNGGFTGAGPAHSTYDATFRAQAGYVIDRHWEPFARYEFINFNGHELPARASHSAVNEFTVGTNYYFYGHRAKLTADLSYLPEGCPVNDDASDILANRGGNELLVRVQFQLIL